MSTINPETVTSRAETEKTGAETPAENTRSESMQDDVVRRAEFRLLLWMQGFTLTILVSALAFLYTGVADLRVELAEQRVEFQAVIADLRADMEVQHAGIRTEVASLRERVVSLEERVASLDRRVTRIETLLDAEFRPPQEGNGSS